MRKKQEKNWFVAQEQKKTQANKPAPVAVKATRKKVIEVKSPILTVLEKSKKEDEHFERALAFANRVSHPTSEVLQTVHLTMDDTLVFNMPQDPQFKKLWENCQLALLVTFPCNWKTISLKALSKLIVLDLDLDAEDDEDDSEFEEWDQMDADERFDLLFETGLRMYEKNR